MPDLAAAKREMTGYCAEIERRAWGANHLGNMSVRLDDHRFLVTPSGVPKRDISEGRLLVIDIEGSSIEGPGKVFSEWVLHRAAYLARPDVGAVVHLHPPHACALASANEGLTSHINVEAAVSLGPKVPLVPFAMPYGEGAGQAEAEALRGAQVILMAGHGPLAVGRCLEQAWLRMELVEHLCRVELLGRAVGGVRPINEAAMSAAVGKHFRAGLGPGAGGPSAAPIATGPVFVDGRPPIPAKTYISQVNPTPTPDSSMERLGLQGPAPSAWMGGPGVRTEGACGVVAGTSATTGTTSANVAASAESAPPVSAFSTAGFTASGLGVATPNLKKRPTAADLGDLVNREIKRVLGG